MSLSHRMMLPFGLLGPAGVVLAALFFLFVFPALIRWVWNLTLPEMFRFPTIGHWQAFRLMVLAGMLFGFAHFL